jgi:hypothetical protein
MGVMDRAWLEDRRGQSAWAALFGVLLTGEARTTLELVRAAGLTVVQVHTRLEQLKLRGIARVEVHAQRPYWRVASPTAARALQALGLEPRADAIALRWRRQCNQPLKRARRCDGHLAGELGVAQMKALRACDWVRLEGAHAVLTPAARTWAAAHGISVASEARGARRCLDWSERRDHLGGAFARALLDYELAQGWLRAAAVPRALELTALGERVFLPWLNGAHVPL